MSAVWSSVIAVAGTLAGGLVPVWLQGRRARDGRREERSAARQAVVLGSVTALFAALADHRRAMWVLEDLRLSPAVSEHAVAEATAVTHETRSAINVPLATVRVLAPVLADPAAVATQAVYALRRAPGRDVLEARRAAALAAANQFLEAASEFLAVLDGKREAAS